MTIEQVLPGTQATLQSTPQVFHEAERQRQHVRLRFPVTVDLAGQSYPARDWSVGGFALDGAPANLSKGQMVPVKLRFAFAGFDLASDFEAEVRHLGKGGRHAGFRFVNLDRERLATLHYISQAYISGEIVTVGDVLQMTRGADFSSSARNALPAENRTPLQRLFHGTRRMLRTLLVIGVALVLVFLVVSAVHNRLFVIPATTSVVSAPVVVVRSLQPAIFESINDVKVGSTVSRGDPIGFLKVASGGSINVDSPCDCDVIQQTTVSGNFAGIGEPLLVLLPHGATTKVVAQIASYDLSTFAVGDPAEITLPDGTVTTGRVTGVRSASTAADAQSTPPRAAPSMALTYVEVDITPHETLPIDMLDTPVSVTIDTFARRIDQLRQSVWGIFG